MDQEWNSDKYRFKDTRMDLKNCHEFPPSSEKIHIGAIDSAGGPAHPDFAGAAAGIARVGLLALDLGCFPFRGGLGQFGNEEASVARKGTTACAFWNQYLIAAGLRDAFQFCCNPHFVTEHTGWKSDGVSLGLNRQPGQQLSWTNSMASRKISRSKRFWFSGLQISPRCF